MIPYAKPQAGRPLCGVPIWSCGLGPQSPFPPRLCIDNQIPGSREATQREHVFRLEKLLVQFRKPTQNRETQSPWPNRSLLPTRQSPSKCSEPNAGPADQANRFFSQVEATTSSGGSARAAEQLRLHPFQRFVPTCPPRPNDTAPRLRSYQTTLAAST
jgi:hypothetical protein